MVSCIQDFVQFVVSTSCSSHVASTDACAIIWALGVLDPSPSQESVSMLCELAQQITADDAAPLQLRDWADVLWAMSNICGQRKSEMHLACESHAPAAVLQERPPLFTVGAGSDQNAASKAADESEVRVSP
jgi:hypothetical protein